MLIVLYKNHGGENEQVEQLLKENDIQYEPVERPVDHPELLSRDGVYVGFDSIKGYISLLLSERKSCN